MTVGRPNSYGVPEQWFAQRWWFGHESDPSRIHLSPRGGNLFFSSSAFPCMVIPHSLTYYISSSLALSYLRHPLSAIKPICLIFLFTSKFSSSTTCDNHNKPRVAISPPLLYPCYCLHTLRVLYFSLSHCLPVLNMLFFSSGQTRFLLAFSLAGSQEKEDNNGEEAGCDSKTDDEAKSHVIHGCFEQAVTRYE